MGLKNGIIAAVAASATLASGLGFVASADAATPAGKAAGTIRVGVDPANCDHVGALGSSGVNGTSRWSLGRDGTLAIGAGTLASGCAYVAVDANGKKKGNTNVKKIKLTGQVTAGADSSYLFAWMGNAAEFDGLEKLNTGSVTNMHAMFEEDPALSSLDVSKFDTSSVTGMNSMFDNDWVLSSLDVSNWDTGRVTAMGGMFNDDSALSSLDVSNWDTGRVTNMHAMFEGDSALSSLDVSKFDTSRVTNMHAMFAGDSALSSLDVSNWDTGRVTDMGGIFYYDSALSSLDVSHFDTSRVADMDDMFASDAALSSLDVSHFDTSRVIDMNGMFEIAGLREVKFGSNFRFIGGNGAAGFPEAGSDGSGRYTGKWVNVGSGTVGDPRGANVWDAGQLMASYDGSRDADTYVWQPKAPVVSPGVTVKYVDEQGNRVHADQSITGNVGASYDASTSVYRLDVRGYTLDGSKLPVNAKGVLSDKPVTVTYTYRKAVAPAPAPNNNGGNNGGNANAGGNGGSGSLATTGASIALASLGGVALLVAGVALLWRRRRA